MRLRKSEPQEMKGKFGEPWEVDEAEKGYRILAPVGEATEMQAYLVVAKSDSERLSDRIVACVDACDGIDPTKLATFLEASAVMRGLVAFRQTEPKLGPIAEWCAVYDALTGGLVGDAV